MEAIHDKHPFYSHPQRENKHKHQNVFIGANSEELLKPSHVGYLAENDPYEANAFEVLRSKWINDSKKLYGDFLSAHGNQSLRQVNRQHLPVAVGYIKRRLLADWNDINFIIGTNPEDYIEIRFAASSFDAPSGLKAYMNTLVDQDEHLTKYCLRKVAQYWGLSNDPKSKGSRANSPNHSAAGPGHDSFIYYMLAPPWAHARDPVLYLLQLPAASPSPSQDLDDY